MPKNTAHKKPKTIKSITKRFKITKKGKVIKRTDSQNHFNAKAPGKITRKRRRNLELAAPDAKSIKRVMQ